MAKQKLARVSLTKAAIEKLQAPDPSGKQRLIWDGELRGFGLLVSGSTPSKTYVVQRTLPDGRTRRMTIGSVAEIDIKRARDEAASLLHEMRTADPKAARRSAAKWTLQSALDDFLKNSASLKEKTAKDYRAFIELNLSEWLSLPLASITADMVERKHREIIARVRERAHAKALKAGREAIKPTGFASASRGGATANSTFVIFRAVWNYVADRDPTLPACPTRRLKRAWAPSPRRERIVRPEEMPAFYKAVQNLENQVAADFIRLLLFTGLRRTEAAALAWTEVDFVHKIIRLPATRTKAGRKLDLPMSTHIRDLLIARRALGNDGGWVFGANSATGHFVEPASAFEAIERECGIRVSAHDLRRTFITIAESCDISPVALKALSNHSLGADVTSGYIQITVERLREPAQRVADRIAQLCGIEIPTKSDNVTNLVR